MQVHHKDSKLGVDSIDKDTFRAEIIPQDDLDVEDGLDLPCCHASANDNRTVSCTYHPIEVYSPSRYVRCTTAVTVYFPKTESLNFEQSV